MKDWVYVFGRLHEKGQTKRTEDQIQVSKFIKIVRNYLTMEKILKNEGYKGI
jgi:hypothetical protein